MPAFEFHCTLPLSAAEAFAWHARPGAFERLLPPWERIATVEGDAGIGEGARRTFVLRKGPWRIAWEARHSRVVEGREFVDEMVRGPFSAWRHLHRFQPVSESECVLRDRIEFGMPLGWIGRAAEGAVERRLERLFRWRHLRTQRDIVRHSQFRGRPPLKIALGGASGLIGRQLAAFLGGGGHTVVPLVRGAAATAQDGIRWNPRRDEIESAALEGFDAVIHLGGENIAGGAWTPERKAAIRESRVRSTALLAQTIAGLKRPPRAFLCASATGYYGDRGAEPLGEESAAGEGFLPQVCQDWERATEPATAAGVRVVNLRFGIVLTPLGGALAKMLAPFRLGLGGVMGSGRQYMSWVALDDVIGAIHFALMKEALRGPVNLTAPEPVTNREFTRTLARLLRRPAVVRVPAAAVRWLLGEMGERLLLEGARVEPRRLGEAGFDFVTPDLEQALRFELGYF